MDFLHKTLFLDQFTPVGIYYKIKKLFTDEITFLFESALNNNDGNFSYIVIGDRERIWHKDGESFFKNELGQVSKISNNPFIFMKEYYKRFDTNIFKAISSEVGIGLIDGFIGNIGYDMVCEFELKLKQNMSNLKDEINIADFDLIRPKIVLGYSHKSSKLVVISSDLAQEQNIDKIVECFNEPMENRPLIKAKVLEEGKFSFSKEQFFEMVAQSKKMIRSGDVFQILMSNRYTQKIEVDHLSFYRALRSKNPSPYLFLLQYENFSIAGSSPEVMVRLTDGKILLRPIAGTRKRGKTIQHAQA